MGESVRWTELDDLCCRLGGKPPLTEEGFHKLATADDVYAAAQSLADREWGCGFWKAAHVVFQYHHVLDVCQHQGDPERLLEGKWARTLKLFTDMANVCWTLAQPNAVYDERMRLVCKELADEWVKARNDELMPPPEQRLT